MERKILTEFEHLEYVHSCGETGAELEVSKSCDKCKIGTPEVYGACLKDHGLSGIDDSATEESIKNFLDSKNGKEKL